MISRLQHLDPPQGSRLHCRIRIGEDVVEATAKDLSKRSKGFRISTDR